MPASPSEIYRQQARFEAAYTVTEAARILRVSRTTLDYWARGKFVNTEVGRIPTRDAMIDVARMEKPCMLSFVNLLEAHVLKLITQEHGIKLPKVRDTLNFLKDKFGDEHPLVLRDFSISGEDLLFKESGMYMDRNEQLVMERILKLYWRRVEYREDDPIAGAYFPLMHPGEVEGPKPIRIDPLIAFGNPVLNGTGYRTDMIAYRSWAGDSIELLAEEYALEKDQIQQAIDWEETQRSLRSAA